MYNTNSMSTDKLSLKGQGYIWELILQGGGVKNFILILGIVGTISFLFTWVTGSLLPLGLFATVTVAIIWFLCHLANSPEGRMFFLDTNSYVRIVKMQMALMSDKSGPKQMGAKTQFVQPVLETQGDIITEAKLDTKKALQKQI